MKKIITEFLIFNLFWLDEKAELGPGYRLIESVPLAMRWQHYALCTVAVAALCTMPSGGRAHQQTMSFLPSLYLAGGPCVRLDFCFVPASIHLLATFYLRC